MTDLTAAAERRRVALLVCASPRLRQRSRHARAQAAGALLRRRAQLLATLPRPRTEPALPAGG